MPINFKPYNPNQIAEAVMLQQQIANQQQALQQRDVQAAMEAQIFAQQQQQRPLNDALNQLKLAEAQQAASQAPLRQALLAEEMRKALMTPQQKALAAAEAANIAQLASQPGVRFQEGGPIEEVTPEAQNILGMRQIAADDAGITFSREGVPGIQMQTAIPGLPGAVRSPAAKREDEALLSSKLAQDVTRASEMAKAKFDATPPGYEIRFDATTGNAFYVPKTPGRGEVQAITNPETGGQLKGKVSGAGGLTANAKSNIFAKAGTAGITRQQIDSKYTKDGVIDFDQIVLDSNRTISQDKTRAAEEKLKQLAPAEKAKATGFISAHNDLKVMLNMAKEMQVQGDEPGAWDRAVGVALQSPPDSIFTALYQSTIGQGLTTDEKALNALKSMVSSAVTRANAGLSQTEREIANVSQYVPQINASLTETLEKGMLLERYLVNQVESITTDPKDWLTRIKAEKAGGGTPTATPPSATASDRIKSFRQKHGVQ